MYLLHKPKQKSFILFAIGQYKLQCSKQWQNSRFKNIPLYNSIGNELHSYFYTKNKPVTGQVKQTLKIIKHNTLNTERPINYCLIATLLKQLQYKRTQHSFPNKTIQGRRFWRFCRLQKGTKKNKQKNKTGCIFRTKGL